MNAQRKSILFILAFLCIVCFHIFTFQNLIFGFEKLKTSDTSDSSEIIKNRIEKKFSTIDSFMVDFNINNNGESVTGKAFYKLTPHKRFKVVWKYPDGEEAIKYYDGESQLIYIPSRNVAIRNLSSEGVIGSSDIELDATVFKNVYAYEDNKFYYYEVILPTPKESEITDEIPVKMISFINKDYGYIEKIIFLNRNDEKTDVQEFYNYQLNVLIEDEEFEFISPKGCQIMLQQEVTPKNDQDALRNILGVPGRVPGTHNLIQE